MQTAITIFIVGLCILFVLNKIFPIIGKTLWKGIAGFLKLTHAPAPAYQWALKHYAPVSKGGCSACDKCSKCH